MTGAPWAGYTAMAQTSCQGFVRAFKALDVISDFLLCAGMEGVPTVESLEVDEEIIALMEAAHDEGSKDGRVCAAGGMKAALKALREAGYLRTPAPLPIRGEGWMPIETEPTDGEQYLVTDGTCVIMAEHPNEERIEHDITSCGVGEITHWRRLPAPPGTIETSQLPAAQEAAGRIEAVTDYARRLESLVDRLACDLECYPNLSHTVRLEDIAAARHALGVQPASPGSNYDQLVKRKREEKKDE